LPVNTGRELPLGIGEERFFAGIISKPALALVLRGCGFGLPDLIFSLFLFFVWRFPLLVFFVPLILKTAGFRLKRFFDHPRRVPLLVENYA